MTHLTLLRRVILCLYLLPHIVDYSSFIAFIHDSQEISEDGGAAVVHSVFLVLSEICE